MRHLILALLLASSALSSPMGTYWVHTDAQGHATEVRMAWLNPDPGPEWQLITGRPKDIRLGLDGLRPLSIVGGKWVEDAGVRAQLASVEAQLASDPGKIWDGSAVVDRANAAAVRTNAVEGSLMEEAKSLALERRAFLDLAEIAVTAGRAARAAKAQARADALAQQIADVMRR